MTSHHAQQLGLNVSICCAGDCAVTSCSQNFGSAYFPSAEICVLGMKTLRLPGVWPVAGPDYRMVHIECLRG